MIAANASKWIESQDADHEHPTYRRLINSAAHLLQDCLPSEITTDIILKHSGISKGSLYHHFRDLSDLVETALVYSFSSVVDENIAYIRNLLEEAQCAEDYYTAILDFNDFAQSSERKSFRLNRVRLLGFAVGNPRMTTKLAAEQSRLTQAYAELFAFAQARGWMKPDFDAHAAAVFIQGFTTGRIIDDISSRSMDLEAWKSLILKVAASVFGVAAKT